MQAPAVRNERRHLRAENRVILTHFFCKRYFSIEAGTNRTFFLFLFSHADSSQQRADTDSCSTKLLTSSIFKAGVDLTEF